MNDPQCIAADVDAIVYADDRVPPAYIDANGHMNVGYYSLLFDRALMLPWARLGIVSPEMATAGRGSFALEAHFTYQREVTAGTPLGYGFQVLDHDAKRIHFVMVMSHAEDGWIATTCEQISMCVDLTTRRSSTWPEDVLACIAALYANHKHRPAPPGVGRRIGIRRPVP